MEKKTTTIVPNWIVPQPIEPGTGADISGAEVGVVFRCATCGRPIEECDDGRPGVRISALRWVAKNGRTMFRPRIRPYKTNGKPKETTRQN